MAVATGLFLYRLGSSPLWADEAWSVWLAGHGLGTLFQRATGPDTNMILYYLPLNGWLRLDDSEAWIRLPSALAMVGATAGTWLITRRFAGDRAALIAGIVFATSPLTIRYAQEARSYAFVMLLTVASTWLLLRALERRRWVDWAAYAVVAGLIAYAHYVAMLILVVHAVMTLTHTPRPPMRTLIVVAAVVGSIAAPMIIAMLRSFGGAQSWAVPLRPDLVTTILIELAGATQPLGDPRTVVRLLSIVAAVLVGVWALGRRSSPRDRWRMLSLLAWLILPVAILTITALVIKPVFGTRFLVFVTPPAAILAGIGIARLRPTIAAIATLVVVSAALWGAQAYYTGTGKPDWVGAATHMSAHGSAEDRWFGYETWAATPLVFYADQVGPSDRFPQPVPRRFLESGRRDFEASLTQIARRLAAEGRTVWVAAGSSGTPIDPATAPQLAPLRAEYAATERLELYHLALVRFEPQSR